jgi:hypothetical protein
MLKLKGLLLVEIKSFLPRSSNVSYSLDIKELTIANSFYSSFIS